MAKPRKRVNFYGESVSVIELAERHGLRPKLLHARLSKVRRLDAPSDWALLLAPPLTRAEAGRLGGRVR